MSRKKAMLTRFDSKLVRLKEFADFSVLEDGDKFRFQIGAIKSGGHTISTRTRYRRFDSKLVRLKETLRRA